MRSIRRLSAVLLAILAAGQAPVHQAALHAQLLGEPPEDEAASDPEPSPSRRRAGESGAAKGGAELDKTYRISPGDVVAMTVYPVEEYSREVTVQPDGKIELPLIGSLLVKGLTAKELVDLLKQRYSKYVAKPEITITVRKFGSRRIAIIGEIRSPGFFEYRDGMKLLELVSQAGGITDAARASRVMILRKGPSGSDASLRVNFKAVLDGNLSRDPALEPGDTVHIPKAPITLGAEWTGKNILPWLSLLTVIIGTIALVKTSKKT